MLYSSEPMASVLNQTLKLIQTRYIDSDYLGKNPSQFKAQKKVDCIGTFVGDPYDMGWGRLYGGHLLAQASDAAWKTVKGNKLLLTPQQISWNYKHYYKGGSCFILATPLEQSTIKIYGGGESRELSLNVHKITPLLSVDKPFDWGRVHETLTTPR